MSLTKFKTIEPRVIINKPHHSREEKLEWLKAFNEGMTCQEVANKFRVHERTVTRVFRNELGVLAQPSKRLTTTETHRCCSICKEWKSLDEFNNAKHQYAGKSYRCRKCVSGSGREAALMQKYNLSKEDYLLLKEKQGNACAICREEAISEFGLHVDHNHQTGEIRGLLCIGCNTGIGSLGEDIEVLERATKYLKGEV